MAAPTVRTGTICYIAIPVTDSARSAEFYHQVFARPPQWIRQQSEGGVKHDRRSHAGWLSDESRALSWLGSSARLRLPMEYVTESTTE